MRFRSVRAGSIGRIADTGRVCGDASDRPKRRNSPPSAVFDDGAELQAATSTTCWSSAKEIRHARPSQ